MKAADIKQGGLYRAKVNGRLATVRVDRIDVYQSSHGTGKKRLVYHVTNTTTRRTTVFRSAVKFKGFAPIVDPADCAPPATHPPETEQEE